MYIAVSDSPFFQNKAAVGSGRSLLRHLQPDEHRLGSLAHAQQLGLFHAPPSQATAASSVGSVQTVLHKLTGDRTRYSR